MTFQKSIWNLLIVVIISQNFVWAQQPGPTLITPENESIAVSWESTSFGWSLIDNASIYQIEIELNDQGDFESPFLSEFVENNSIEIYDLFSNWRFNWRVRAGFQDSTEEYRFSEWSEVFAFNTTYIAPQNDVPPDSSMGEDFNSVQLEWQLDIDPQIPSEENKYDVQVATDDGFASVVYEEMVLSGNFLSLSDLMASTRYFWRVKYYNMYGESSWSEPTSFVTLAPDLEQVVLLSPENMQSAVNPNNVNFSWEEVQNAESYNIEISEDSLFNDILESSLVFSLEYMTSIALQSTRIFWRVQAINTDGDGPWSQVWYFETSITAPQTPPAQLSPEDSSSGYSAGNLEFEWRGVHGAESYGIEVASDINFTDLLATEMVIDTSIVLDLDLVDGNYYYWRVNAKNDSGTGPWSDTGVFYAGMITSLENDGLLAQEFSLLPNFPNPFNPSTTIRYHIATQSAVKIMIYNILGQHISTLLNQTMSPGQYEVNWNGKNVLNQNTSSGVYIYIMEVLTAQGSKIIRSRKMIKLQ